MNERKDYTIEELARGLGSPRLAELFYPLITVAPTGEAQENILSYAKDMQRSRLSELSLSEEAMVLSAILCCYDCGETKNGKVTVQDVKSVLNETIEDPSEWRDSQHVGRIISRLGFDRCKAGGGYAAFWWNQALIDRFKHDDRYKECFADRQVRADAHLEKKRIKSKMPF